MFIVPINQLGTVMPSMGLGLDYRLILVEKVCGVLLCFRWTLLSSPFLVHIG